MFVFFTDYSTASWYFQDHHQPICPEIAHKSNQYPEYCSRTKETSSSPRGSQEEASGTEEGGYQEEDDHSEAEIRIVRQTHTATKGK